MTIPLDREARRIIGAACQDLINEAGRVSHALTGSFPVALSQPPELRDFAAQATSIRDMMAQGGDAIVDVEFDANARPVVRTALALNRRQLAERVEAGLRHLTSTSLSRELQAALRPLDELLGSPTLVDVVARPAPSLADFLTPEGRQQHQATLTLATEEREPKHRILLSSSLISGDITVFRGHCEDRHVPFAVVFADLDDFKAVNTEIGEVLVDRLVLPRILSAVEAAAYGHGRAYRHGGDEFVILVPNATVEVVSSVIGQLKKAVEGLRFDGSAFVPRLSAGVWITVPSSHLTPIELVARASEAKAASKAAGKSRITIWSEIGSQYSEVVVQ